MLTDGFTFTSAPPPDPAPTVTSISPSGGPETGGTPVTINGTGFAAGATVSLGGTPATQVNVVSSTVITATTAAHMPGPVDVVVTNSDGQSGMLTEGFIYSPASTTETVLLQDDFNDNQLDGEKWIHGNLFSGFTDSNVPALETGQRLEIGALLQNAGGSHYNGIRSETTHDLTGAYCYVELVQPGAANTTADAMFTIGKDANNYYRAYVEAGTLIWQKRIGGTKINLFSATYNSVNHRYLRVRHDSATGEVVFETAGNDGGSPGTWTERHREQWNTGAVPVNRVLFELKAGTWQPESNAPGKVIFDNFRAAKP
jgi:hypothetical protein